MESNPSLETCQTNIDRLLGEIATRQAEISEWERLGHIAVENMVAEMVESRHEDHET